MGSKIKVIIAEDNLDAQEILQSFIAPLKNYEVIGIAGDGESLLDLIVNEIPDLILADINMPKIDGIQAIESCLQVNPQLKVIFTTAYDEHAVKAFDINAVDYVMKPFKKERLYKALEKARNSFMNYSQEEERKILTVTMDRTSYFVPCSNIIFIEKKQNKTIIHTAERKYETYETLDSILKKLNNRFFRTHRSFITNIDFISHITIEGETYFAHFRNYPGVAHVSRLQKNELIKQISND